MLTSTVISLALGAIAKKVLETLIGKVTEELWARLKGDPAQKAFAAALGLAISRYAASGMGSAAITRLELAGPLSSEDSPLKIQDVAVELAQLLRFEPKPNASLVGERWKKSLSDPPVWIDFTQEAELLLTLQRRLHLTC